MIAKRHSLRPEHTPTVRLSSIRTTPTLTLSSSYLCWPQELFDAAVSHARKAVQLAPGAADILNQAGFILAPSGFPEEALILAQKSIALNPNHPAVYLGILGNACRLSGHIDEAIAAFEAYNARVPGFGLVDLVIAYREKGQAEKAEDAAKRLLDLGARGVVLTMGPDGSLLMTDRDRMRLPAHEVAVVDTSGCGDAYCAGFIRGLLLGWEPIECARLGNAAAALVAQGLGSDAGIRDLDDTLRFMRETPLRAA